MRAGLEGRRVHRRPCMWSVCSPPSAWPHERHGRDVVDGPALTLATAAPGGRTQRVRSSVARAGQARVDSTVPAHGQIELFQFTDGQEASPALSPANAGSNFFADAFAVRVDRGVASKGGHWPDRGGLGLGQGRLRGGQGSGLARGWPEGGQHVAGGLLRAGQDRPGLGQGASVADGDIVGPARAKWKR